MESEKYFLITVESQDKPCGVVHKTTLVINTTPIEWMLDWVKITKERKNRPTPAYVITYSEEITKEQHNKFGDMEMSIWE